MRILLAWYPAEDNGGIINHNEQLAAGLLELGHEVQTACFLPREDRPRNGVAGGRGTVSPYTKLEYDQRRGYSWSYFSTIPYRHSAKQNAIAFIESFDLVIWQIAVPTKRKENVGNLDWMDLYGANTTHIAVIHDGNFLNSYPWLYHVKDRLTALACVHDCAYNSARHISVPSALILNPQDIEEPPDLSSSAFHRRKKGFLSVQTFKAWKHVPELVAAMPYMGLETKLLAGKGIDYYYLTSKDKCKWPGIWDSAVQHGMEYLDVITNEQRDQILSEVTCLVDPSWSKKYKDIGAHFNRVMVDAIKMGALPIVRPWGIGEGAQGRNIGLFEAGRNCMAVPQGVDSYEYGRTVTDICNLPYEKYREIMDNAVQLLPSFDRFHIAQQFIALANGRMETEAGENSPDVIYNSNYNIHTFFSGEI